MAISQTKYIEIKSVIANNLVGNRDMNGLVFTKSEMINGASKKSDYDSGKIIALSPTDASKFFGSTVFIDGEKTNDAPVTDFATKYFSYVGPSGRSPRALYVVKVLEGETVKQAFDRVVEETDNFGSYTFIGSDFTAAATKTAFESNADNKFLAVFGEKVSLNEDGITYNFTGAKANAAVFGDVKGLHHVVGADEYCAAMPMAILASTNYNTGVNSVVNYMFRTFSGETPVVTTDTDYTELSKLHINFYGKTQANGRTISFYQRGFNRDGVDTGVYCNEAWLKTAIAASFLNFLTTIARIPANYAGAGMCRNAIMGDITQALANGTIMIGKTLTPAQKAIIFQYSNDELAWESVQNEGYWLDVVIVADGNDYKAVYRLVYSKGDSIRFIDGTHNLI